MRQTSAFVPKTITPPARPLQGMKFFATAARNVLEVLDDGMFETPVRVVRYHGRISAAVMDPALIEQVLLTDAGDYRRGNVQQRLFAPLFPKGLLTTDGETWKRQRRAASPPFRAVALEGLVPVMAEAGEAAASTLAASAGQGASDVMPVMARATFDVIRETLLGGDGTAIPAQEMFDAIDEFIVHGARLDPILILGLPDWLPRPGKSRARRAGRVMRRHAEAALAARRQAREPRQDLLQAMLDARDPQTGAGLDDAELVDNVLTFIAAGHETTALALTWSLYLLAGAPDIQEALAAEVASVCGDGPVTADLLPRLELTDRVIREALRLYPAAPFIQRTPVKEMTLSGHVLPPGANVTCMIYVTHRSRLYWDAPERFDPDRFLPARSEGRHRSAWLPFGGGPHVCIGARFAMMEAVAILAAIIRQVRVSLPGDLEVVPVQRITLRPQHGMRLRIERR